MDSNLGKMTVAQCLQLYIQKSDIFEQSDPLPLLKMIIKINFPFLQQLNQTDENLLNIEQMAFQNMENLKRLQLYRNNIINFKPLNKQKWNNFKYFSFLANSIKGVDLSRIKFNKQFSLLEYNFYRFRQMEVERTRGIFYGDIKLQKIGTFRLYQDLNYLQQPKILIKLKERYPGINVQPMKGNNFIINLE